MSPAEEFAHIPNPSPTSVGRRAEILAQPGFGKYFTDHMVSIDYTTGDGWHNPRVEPYGSLTMEPAAMVYHYGQAIFEGLKAYRQPDGSIACFRPQFNARRFQLSARRMAMPELPEELFLESIRRLLAVDHGWVPEAGEDSLYLRPFMISTDTGLGVKPSDGYRFMLIASPAGVYFSGTVAVWVSTEYVRAAPGGTGEAKFAGNYAASLAAQAQAAEHDCAQVVWLDAAERRYIEEMGSNNLFFVSGSGADAKLVTPELTGSLLRGVTRESVLTLAADAGYSVEERRVSFDEWRKKAAAGEIAESFGCGTAAVITPIGTVRSADGEFTIGGGKAGELTMALRHTLTGIQRGTFQDIHGWLTTMR